MLFCRRGLVLISTVLLLALTAASPAASADRIGAVLPGYILGFFQGLEKGMRSAAHDQKVELLIRSPADGSALDTQKNVQLRIIEFMLNRGVSGIVLAPEPLSDVPTPVTLPVPLVLVDREGPQFSALSLVATDNYDAGRQAALSLEPVLAKGANVAVLRLAADIPSTTERENGFVSVARDKGWNVVIDTFVGYKLRETKARIAEVLGSYEGKLDAVFVPNETTAYGAVRVVKELYSSGERPYLVAFDWRPDFGAALADGTLYATVLQDPYSMGYRALTAAVEASRGKTLAPRESIDVVVVTNANLHTPTTKALIENYEN